MSKKYIVANWKMQPQTLAEAEQILDFVNDHLESRNEKEFSLIFCPPFVFLEEVGKVLKNSHLEHESSLGAQDIFWEDMGADTGLGEGSRAKPGISVEVSGPMLSKLGVEYVIVGHSERRWKLGESDEIVNKKLKAVLRNDLIPIVCLGERVQDKNFKEFLKEQVYATFAGLSADEIGKCMIAYEPVWAISSNPGARPDTPESALDSIHIIQEVLIENWKLKIGNLPKTLYGGSITSANVLSFLQHDEFSGVLIGGASVNKVEFVKILSLVK